MFTPQRGCQIHHPPPVQQDRTDAAARERGEREGEWVGGRKNESERREVQQDPRTRAHPGFAVSNNNQPAGGALSQAHPHGSPCSFILIKCSVSGSSLFLCVLPQNAICKCNSGFPDRQFKKIKSLIIHFEGNVRARKGNRVQSAAQTET